MFIGDVFAQHQDGEINPTFISASGVDMDIFKVLTQPDGKVLIGGMFSEYNGVERSGIARINSDGSLDLDFNPAIEYGGYIGIIRNIALQEDGKIIVVGEFSHCQGEERTAIARLNSDGSLDESFNPVFNTTDFLGEDIFPAEIMIGVNVVEDGKILVYGDFRECNGVDRKGIARLNSDGSLDETFYFVEGLHQLGDRKTNNFIVQSDGKILVGGKGDMTIYEGDTIKGLFRLLPNGEFDSEFLHSLTPESEDNIRVYSIASLPNNDVLVAWVQESGGFSSGGFFLKKLKGENGQIDSSFSFYDVIEDGETLNVIYSIQPTEDGKIVLGRDESIVRILENGDLDETFKNDNEIDGRVYDFDFLVDEGMLIGGTFININSELVNGIARLYYNYEVSGIEKSEMDNLVVYPNPANNVITILDAPLNSKVIITNIAGQKLKEILVHSNIVQVDVSSLENGVYLVSIIQDDKKLVNKLLINK